MLSLLFTAIAALTAAASDRYLVGLFFTLSAEKINNRIVEVQTSVKIYASRDCLEGVLKMWTG
jgi:hypothetical protein